MKKKQPTVQTIAYRIRRAVIQALAEFKPLPIADECDLACKALQEVSFEFFKQSEAEGNEE